MISCNSPGHNQHDPDPVISPECVPLSVCQKVYHWLGVQDRFQHIVPTLNKLGNTTVGLTLILIGVLGIVESRQHQQEQAEQLQPVTTEGTVIQGEFVCLLTSGCLQKSQCAASWCFYHHGLAF